jgi:hypothetical protein
VNATAGPPVATAAELGETATGGSMVMVAEAVLVPEVVVRVADVAVEAEAGGV